MASTQGKNSEAFQRKLAALKKKSLDIKFDLENTDYNPIENIGIGAYGVVCSAVHQKTKDRVAIKKIPRIFEYEKIATTTYREIKILKHFKHDNIISIRDILKPREDMANFRDIYVVFDLMESDLHKIIYSKQDLSEEHVRYFLYQLLRGLKYIHSANVIHRDLKPSNLLVNEDCLLRIGDFGMARGLSSTPEEPNHFMTQYVATRWYRAPEIMLALVEYGTAVDMWSVGCIFAEMLGRKHLFPGRDYINQIKLIVGVLGSPSDKLLELCQSDIIKKFITQLGKKDSISWTTLFPKASRKAVDVISKMLVLHPGERLTVDKALKHPYLSKYHDPDDEPICVPTFNFDFENEDMNKEKLRKLIYKEIMDYHEPRTPTLSFQACLKPVPKEATCTITTAIKQEDSREQGPQIILKPPVEGLQVVPNEEFKKPLEVKKEEPKFTFDKIKLVVSSTDVEMLSAKSEDGRPKSSAPVLQLKEEIKKESKKGDNKTISSDTKALVKAALLNSSLKKQRSESLGESDDRPKPVTAAQRQKEREEKRKKKKEKAMERMKKTKEKKGNQAKTELLTDADRELLQRWSKMQKANQPIAPKPDTTVQAPVTTAAVTSLIESGQTPGQQCLQQYLATQFQKKLTTATEVKSQGQCSVGQSITGTTIVLQTGQTTAKPLQTIHAVSGIKQPQNVQHGASNQGQNLVSFTQETMESTGNEQRILGNSLQKQNETIGSNMELSTINFENLKMLGIMTSQNPQNSENFQNGTFFQSQQSLPFASGSQGMNDTDNMTTDSNHTTFSQDFRVVSHGSPASQQGSPQKDYSNHSSPESYQSHGSPEYFQTGDPPQQGRLSFSDATDTQQRSPQPVFQQQNSPQSVYQQQPSPPSVFQNQGSPHDQSSYQQQSSPQQPSYHSHGSPQDAGHYDRRPSDDQLQNFQQGFGQFERRSSGDDQLQDQSCQQSFINFERRSDDQNQSRVSNTSAGASNNTLLSLEAVQDLGQHINQIPYAPVMLDGDNSFHDHSNFFQESNQAHVPFKLGGTSATNQNSQLSNPSNDPTFFSRFPRTSAASGSSSQLPFHANSPPDLITSLSRQLSKSQVEDSGPPALALTPRGTGAGYGVGMDVDALMVDAQEIMPTRPEPSPLSSSLLTDWMEVTGNLNIDIDALEQELSLQSPMTLSYNDLSMYPS